MFYVIYNILIKIQNLYKKQTEISLYVKKQESEIGAQLETETHS